LREIGNIKKEAFIRNNIGLEHDIVIETLGDAMAKGTTSNYIRVHVSDNSVLKPGSLVRVRLTGARDGNASGIAL
jgi:tRNA A37 methylthiotransferase MiaB